MVSEFESFRFFFTIFFFKDLLLYHIGKPKILIIWKNAIIEQNNLKFDLGVVAEVLEVVEHIYTVQLEVIKVILGSFSALVSKWYWHVTRKWFLI